MRKFFLGTLASLVLFGCSHNPKHTIRSIDPKTLVGYEIQLIDRNKNGKIDLIKTYLVCEGIKVNEPIMEKDLIERRVKIDAEYYSLSKHYREQKDFKTDITWNYPYEECETLSIQNG